MAFTPTGALDWGGQGSCTCRELGVAPAFPQRAPTGKGSWGGQTSSQQAVCDELKEHQIVFTRKTHSHSLEGVLPVGAAPTCPMGSPSAITRGGVARGCRSLVPEGLSVGNKRRTRGCCSILTRGCCMWVPLPRARRAHRRQKRDLWPHLKAYDATTGVFRMRHSHGKEGVLHTGFTCGRISRPTIRPQG